MDISYLFAVKENEQMDKTEDKSLRQGQKARNQDKTEDKSLRQGQKARNQDKTEEKTLNKVRKTTSSNWPGCLSGWSIVFRCLARVSQWVEHSTQVSGPGVSEFTEVAVLTEFAVRSPHKSAASSHWVELSTQLPGSGVLRPLSSAYCLAWSMKACRRSSMEASSCPSLAMLPIFFSFQKSIVDKGV